MNTTNVLTAVSTLNNNISNNLHTIADFQSKISDWDLLPDSEKPKEVDTGKPIDIEDLHGLLDGITIETISLFDTMTSMTKALLESVPEKEIIIYTQN